eukprot:jgi/Chrzof1/13348/Cz07g29220.t1
MAAAMRFEDGHYLLGASPGLLMSLAGVIGTLYDVPWETPESAIVTAYLTLLPNDFTGQFPPNPDAFFAGALHEYPEDSVLWWYKATYNMFKGRQSEALHALNKAIQLNCPFTTLHDRGSVRRNLDDYAGARRDYKAALETFPVEHRSRPSIYSQLSWMEIVEHRRASMAKLEKGLVWYHKGLEAEKQLPDFLEVGEPIDSKRIMCTALVAAGLLKPNGKELTLKGQEAVNRLLQHERQQQQEQQQPLPVSPGDSSRGKQAVSQAPAGVSGGDDHEEDNTDQPAEPSTSASAAAAAAPEAMATHSTSVAAGTAAPSTLAAAVATPSTPAAATAAPSTSAAVAAPMECISTTSEANGSTQQQEQPPPSTAAAAAGAASPVKKSSKRLCAWCHNKPEGKAKFCGRCKSTFYCSRECQQQHWPEHKKTCKSTEES